MVFKIMSSKMLNILPYDLIHTVCFFKTDSLGTHNWITVKNLLK